jgi:uncharacterized protein
MGMRVIITGGSGLIGRALAEDLRCDGHEVIVVSRNPEQTAARLPEGVKSLPWDGATAAGWGEAVNGAGAVVNLAGSNISGGRWTEKQKKLILESRVKAGQAVVAAVEQAVDLPRVVIQSSGIDYYGSHSGERQITEKMPPGKGFLSQVCVEWENSTAALDQYGIRRPVIRTGVVLSTKGGALPRMALPFKLFAGGPIGHGRQWFSWIQIADQVAAMRFLIEHPRATGPFNLVSPNPVSNARFARILGRVLNRPAIFPVPAIVLKVIFGEMASLLLGGQRAVPKRLQELGFKFRYAEAEPALRDLYGK